MRGGPVAPPGGRMRDGGPARSSQARSVRRSPHGHLDTPTSVSIDLPLVATYGSNGLNALGDPTRRAIFERLGRGPLPVREIAKDLPVRRPAVSQPLKVLKDAGLVIDRPDGTRRLYQLDPTGIEAMRAYFDTFWNQALTAFKHAVEKEDS